MKLRRSFKKLKKPNLPLGLYRVVGESMLPALKPGTIVVALRRCTIQAGDVIVFRHNALDKIKRISELHSQTLFVRGDNLAASTDSRHFGPVAITAVMGKVIWPRS